MPQMGPLMWFNLFVTLFLLINIFYMNLSNKSSSFTFSTNTSTPNYQVSHWTW